MTQSKLNQVIAVSKTKKARAKSTYSDCTSFFGKNGLFSGMIRNYRPVNDEDERLPSESHRVQMTVPEVFEALQEPWVEMVDVVFTQDSGNTEAIANLQIGSASISVPVTTLIFLEKELIGLRQLILNAPLLSSDTEWARDTVDNLYKSNEVVTSRTKKVQKAIVLYDATDKHPAQTQLITEDELTGYWHTRAISGAISQQERDIILARIDSMTEAIVRAREEANNLSIENRQIGEKIWREIFSF